jgi:FMN-dependent oxidoreductase (nitrilotriacetate monooxygenase family)
MAPRSEKLRLGVFFHPTGHHTAAWRHPDAQADAGINFQHYKEITQTAERAKFDMVFLADNLSVREGAMDALSRSAVYIANIEPMVMISALAAVTTHIGLVSTASTSFHEPYHLARKFASLDHLSKGRAGWNIVTSSQDAEARNFGRDSHFDHKERYDRAAEFTRVVLGLWDSWDDDAFLRDKKSGLFFDPEKLHTLDHRGEHFSVKGPLNVPRSPQGRPVLIQAGVSDDARAFASEVADVVFTNHLNLEMAKPYYDQVKARASDIGRRPEDIKVMPGLIPLVGRTSEEAEEKFQALNDLIDPVVAREFLSLLLKTNLVNVPLDEPLPELELPPKASWQFYNWVDLARRENLTVRQLAMRAAVGRVNTIRGSATDIADYIQFWFEEEACDGFNIMPPYLPGAFDDFVELVVPELQRRGLFRKEYEGTTLRENLGLRRPQSRYSIKELTT